MVTIRVCYWCPFINCIRFHFKRKTWFCDLIVNRHRFYFSIVNSNFFCLFGFHFSVWVAIYELVHRKKLMHAVYAAVMGQHARNQCTNGIWHQCLYARQLAAVVSSIQPFFCTFSHFFSQILGVLFHSNSNFQDKFGSFFPVNFVGYDTMRTKINRNSWTISIFLFDSANKINKISNKLWMSEIGWK